MIIQIRGTSGSGKTTLIRKLMTELLRQRPSGDDSLFEPHYEEKRKKPLWYRFNLNGKGLFILGHYESPCGGCDTVGSAAAVFDLINRVMVAPFNADHIICEGLLLSEDTKWTKELPGFWKCSPTRVLFLTTPLETCLKQIESRRKEVGNDKPLNPANTTNRVATIERARVKLVELGVTCRRAPVDQGVQIVLNWLKEG